MPTVTEQAVTAFAHCIVSRCAGNNQESVQAIRVETGHSYEDLGGDWPFVERSHVSVRFADEADAVCPHCGERREVTLEQRKQYAPLSGHDPMGLLDIQPFDPRLQNELRQQPLADPERERYERENAELRERMAKMEGYLMGQQAGQEDEDPPLAHEEPAE